MMSFTLNIDGFMQIKGPPSPPGLAGHRSIGQRGVTRWYPGLRQIPQTPEQGSANYIADDQDADPLCASVTLTEW